MKLTVQPLTPDAFAPFGQVIARPPSTPTAQMPGLDYWAGVAQLAEVGAPFDVGVAALTVRPFVQTCAERHMLTPELLQPIGGDMIAVVGPADYPETPGRLPPPERFAAFRVPEDTGIIMHPGVWHWAPFPTDTAMSLLVIYRAGTAAHDVTVADFPVGAPLEFEHPA